LPGGEKGKRGRCATELKQPEKRSSTHLPVTERGKKRLIITNKIKRGKGEKKGGRGDVG